MKIFIFILYSFPLPVFCWTLGSFRETVFSFYMCTAFNFLILMSTGNFFMKSCKKLLLRWESPGWCTCHIFIFRWIQTAARLYPLVRLLGTISLLTAILQRAKFTARCTAFWTGDLFWTYHCIFFNSFEMVPRAHPQTAQFKIWQKVLQNFHAEFHRTAIPSSYQKLGQLFITQQIHLVSSSDIIFHKVSHLILIAFTSLIVISHTVWIALSLLGSRRAIVCEQHINLWMPRYFFLASIDGTLKC